MQQDSRKQIHVAVGIVIRDGHVLLAQRPSGKPYAGWWEFPGGKIEAHEDVHTALARELHEELGLTVHHSVPWMVRSHSYEHANVRLYFRCVLDSQGEPSGREDQAYAWIDLRSMPLPMSQDLTRLCDATTIPGGVVQAPTTEHAPYLAQLPVPILPATVPLLPALGLPTQLRVTGQHRFGEQFTSLVDRTLHVHPQAWVVLREPGLASDQTLALAQRIRTVAPACTLLASSIHLAEAASLAPFINGWLVTERDLLAGRIPVRQAGQWLGASVHSVQAITAAYEAGADLAVLGAVQNTRSHPGQQSLGWTQFNEIAAQSSLPLYAIGGLGPADITQAQQNGAHGVAMIDAAWNVLA